MRYKRAVVVTGGRDFFDRGFFEYFLGQLEPDVLLHGNAPGADQTAASVARPYCPVVPYDADWSPKPGDPVGCRRDGTPFNKLGGHRRNERMMRAAAEFPLEVMCLAAPGGTGTADAMKRAKRHGLPVWAPATGQPMPEWRPPAHLPVESDGVSLCELSLTRSYATTLGPMPSVTTVLDATRPKKIEKALRKWEERVGAEEADRIRTAALKRGDIIHKAIEAKIKGGFRPIIKGNVLPFWRSIEPRIDQLLRWCVPVFLERGVYHPEAGFAGTVDALFRNCEGEYIVVDWKTSASRRDPSEEYAVQVSAYGAAIRRLYGIPVTRGLIISAVGDGGPAKQRRVPLVELEEGWVEFQERVKRFGD